MCKRYDEQWNLAVGKQSWQCAEQWIGSDRIEPDAIRNGDRSDCRCQDDRYDVQYVISGRESAVPA